MNCCWWIILLLACRGNFGNSGNRNCGCGSSNCIMPRSCGRNREECGCTHHHEDCGCSHHHMKDDCDMNDNGGYGNDDCGCNNNAVPYNNPFSY